MEGTYGCRIEPELPTTTEQGGDGKEANTERSAKGVEGPVVVYKKGAWSKVEDEKLSRAVEEYGVRNWVTIEKFSGLARPAKNCRLRWLNYLRPNLKKHPITQEEEKLILHLHSKYGNSWSRIAAKLPGRSDNEIKNYWHKRAKKRQKQQLPIYHTTEAERRQTHIKDEPNADNKCFPNCPNHILPSTSTQLTNTQKNASSMIHLPQTLISTSQQLELTHKTTTSPNTPPSQNFYLSPHQRSQSSSSSFFTPLLEPPILFSPQGRFKRFLTPQNQSSTSGSGLPCPTENASAFQSQHPSLQMQRSLNVGSPTSPLKLNLSPGVSQQTIGSSRASLSPVSTFKLCLSSAESNLSILESSNIPLNTLTPAVQRAFPVEPMTVDTDKVIPQYSTFKTKPPLVQFDILETGKTSSSIHEVESDTNLEIMEELREAQARVKFLKKKLRQKRISKKTNLHKLSSGKEDFLGENPETTNLHGRDMEMQVTLNENSSQMTKKECLSSTSSRKKDSQRGGDIITDNSLSKLPELENFENKSYTQESIVSKKGITHEEAYIENLESLQREKDSHSRGEIFKIKNTMNLQEQRHSINLVDHPNSQTTMNGLNSDSWDNKLCPFQVPIIGNFLNGWSTIEGLFIETSTPLQDSFFMRDLFGQTSGIKQSRTDGCGTVYSQSTTTTLVKPCDEAGRLGYLQPDENGYFGDNFGQEDASLMDGNLAISTSSEGNLLSYHYLTTDLQEPSYLVSELMMEHEYLGNSIESSKPCESSLLLPQCSTANLLDSSYLVSKRIMGQESQQGDQFSFQTSKGGDLVEASKLCGSVFLLDHYPESNMMDTKCLAGFDNKCPIVEQYTPQVTTCRYYSGHLKTNCISRETLRQEPSHEDSLMEGLLVENLWPEGQMVSQDQIVLPDRFDQVANPEEISTLTKSKNWNNESDCGHEEIPNQEHNQEHGHMNSSIHPLDWYNNCNTTADEFDKDLSLHVTSTSPPLLTIADYI